MKRCKKSLFVISLCVCILFQLITVSAADRYTLETNLSGWQNAGDGVFADHGTDWDVSADFSSDEKTNHVYVTADKQIDGKHSFTFDAAFSLPHITADGEENADNSEARQLGIISHSVLFGAKDRTFDNQFADTGRIMLMKYPKESAKIVVTLPDGETDEIQMTEAEQATRTYAVTLKYDAAAETLVISVNGEKLFEFTQVSGESMSGYLGFSNVWSVMAVTKAVYTEGEEFVPTPTPEATATPEPTPTPTTAQATATGSKPSATDGKTTDPEKDNDNLWIIIASAAAVVVIAAVVIVIVVRKRKKKS